MSIRLRGVELADLHGHTYARTLVAALLLLLGPSAKAADSRHEFSPDLPALQSAATPIDSIRVTLNNPTVGITDEHTLSFTIPSLLPTNAHLRITYPKGFGFSSLTSATYSDADLANTDPKVDTFTVSSQSVNVYLDSTGSPPVGGALISLKLVHVRNDTVRGDYYVALEVLFPDSTLLFGPTLSRSFRVTPGLPDSIAISPKTALQLDAGTVQSFTTAAFDQYNNRIDTATVAYTVAPTFLGTITSAGAFLAQKVGAGRVHVSYGLFKDSSGAITVRSGPLATWDVTGFPPSGIAGESLGAGNVTVRALDAYGNQKRTTSTGLVVHFEVSDPAALLPAPDTFQAGDTGVVKFQLSSFRFLRAGADTIVTTNDTISVRDPIYINPAPAATFVLDVPDTVVSGQNFVVSVSDGQDAYGNLASGVVVLSLDPGDSLSPDGRPPLLPEVSVANGSGTASAQLYRAGRYPITGRIGSTLVITDSVTILPAAPGRFVWDISSPQVSGEQFAGTATLTAYDPWGNLATNYDPSVPVMLSATNGDSMSNKTLSTGTFANGVADLTNRGVTYYGRGGLIRFLADNGTASGLSGPVNVLAVKLDSLYFDQSTVRRGVDTLTGTISVSVAGSGDFSVTSLQLVSTGTFALSEVTPALPFSFSGPGTRDFVFRWPVPAFLSEGCMSFEAQMQGAFGMDTAQASFSGAPCVSITSAAAFRVDEVYPTEIAYGSVEYWITLANDGPQAVTVDLGGVYALITDNSGRSDSAASVSTGQYLLAEGTAVPLQFTATHAPGFEGDSAFLSLVVAGTEIGQSFTDTIPFGVLHFAGSPALSFLSNSFSPDTLVRGRADTIALRIANSGDSPIDSLSSILSYLRLAGTQDTATLRPLNLISAFSPNSDTTLRFVLTAEASRLAGLKYAPTVTVSGRVNNRAFETTISIPDSVALVGPGQIRIDSVWMTAPNQPFVSTLQDFDVSAAISNTGLERLDSLLLRLSADGGALFVDTASTAPLDPAETATVSWTVTADAAPTALETFTVDVVRAVGAYTRAAATIEPALDAQASVQVQSPALLAVQIEVVSPPSAADLRVAAGSEFVLAARFENSGQAETGTGQLELLLSGGLTTSDPVTVTVSEGDDAAWTIQAPSGEGPATATVRFAGTPIEINTGTPASVATPRDSLLFDIVFEAPPLVVRDVQYDSGMVDDEFVPVSWRWHNEDASGSFPILVQSSEFELLAASSGNVIDAGTLIQSAELQFSNDTVAATFAGGRLHFGTDSLRRIAAGDSEAVNLSVALKTAGALQEFRFATRAVLWSAIERSSGGSGLAVGILDERGLPLDLQTPLAFRPGDEPTNFPNPFRAGLESTQIQYRLNADSPVELVLYTTSGREVWRFHADAGALGGRSGANTVAWDGQNTNGDVVLDGVYIARLSGGGLESTLKIVVIK